MIFNLMFNDLMASSHHDALRYQLGIATPADLGKLRAALSHPEDVARGPPRGGGGSTDLELPFAVVQSEFKRTKTE